MNFLEKLDSLMNKYGLNKRTLSQKSEIPYTTIDGWYKKGYEGLKLTTLRKLADYFNITLDYLVLDEISDPNYGKSIGFKVDYDEMEHIKKYRTLNKHGKEMVGIVLDKEYQHTTTVKEQTPIPESVPTPIHLATYYQKLASAGNRHHFFNDMLESRIAIKKTELAKQSDFAIGVNGDSMEPMLLDGDIVLVEERETVEIGEIGIFILNNR